MKKGITCLFEFPMLYALAQGENRMNGAYTTDNKSYMTKQSGLK